MGEQLYQYKKFYEDGKTVWKRVPYDGGNADAVFPNTPEDQRNGKVMFSGSAKVSSILQKQQDASTLSRLRRDLHPCGYRDISYMKKWAPGKGERHVVSMMWDGPIYEELLELEFSRDGFIHWLASSIHKNAPVVEEWRSSPIGDGKETPYNPLARCLLSKADNVEEPSPATPYNRKLDVE